MSRTGNGQLLQELESYESSDGIVVEAVSRTVENLNRTSAADVLESAALYLFNPATASDELRESDLLATRNCVALTAERAIVMNEDFVRELEAAIRSFNLTESLRESPLLRDDEELFGLVLRIRDDGPRYLQRLRRLRGRGADQGDDRDSSLDQLVMLLTFLVAHEAGHLAEREDRRSFYDRSTSGYAGAQRIRDAVVKLTMHVDEFTRSGFTLGGFEQLADLDSQVRRVAEDMRREIGVMASNHSVWLRSENGADDYALDLLSRLIGDTAGSDPAAAQRDQYLLIRALFVMGIYTWYRDLLDFYQKLDVRGLRNVQELTLLMSQSRSRYVDAAALFGSNHRFTMLRSVLAITGLLEANSDFYQQPSDDRDIWFRGDIGSLEDDPAALRAWRESECLQREWLLRIAMDTAIKIANVGAATGWMLETDRKRGSPQLFLMRFEGIAEAMHRLTHGGRLASEGPG